MLHRVSNVPRPDPLECDDFMCALVCSSTSDGCVCHVLPHSLTSIATIATITTIFISISLISLVATLARRKVASRRSSGDGVGLEVERG